MDFAQTLKKLMDERGVSNYQLAKALNCHQSNVAYWLDGKRTPQKRMRLSIAEYFGVPVSALNIKEKNGMVFDASIVDDFDLDQERVQLALRKKTNSSAPEGAELSEARMKLLAAIEGMSEDEVLAMVQMAEAAKKMRGDRT